jgi:leucine dehydrogenase
MGRIIEGLGGHYIAADDVGTTLADLVIMREVTRHTAGATAAAQQALPATAFGVFEAVRAAAEVCLGRGDLEGLRVAVQGLGNVGMPFCGYLSAAGAALVVSDLDANRCAQAAATYGATVAAPEEIHTQHVDVFAPAALGAVLNDATIPCLRCRVVCGGANNQLAEARHDAALAVRGILFVPGLSGECRRCHRLPSGNHRRPARRGTRFGRAHRRNYPRRATLRRRDRRHPVERRGWHRPGADHPTGVR